MSDVILYAAIATIVCVMLYSVLGKTSGEEGSPDIDMRRPPNDNGLDAGFVAPVENHGGPAGLNDIIAADNQFSPKQFTDGAKGAYAMILEAFAEGDKEELKELLTPSVYEVYAAAIDERAGKSLTQVTDLARLKDAVIVEAENAGGIATVRVQFDAELSSALLDADGQTVEGDPDLLATVSEIWTFERELKSKDPNWLLSDVAPSEGDTLEADPTPDTTA